MTKNILLYVIICIVLINCDDNTTVGSGMVSGSVTSSSSIEDDAKVYATLVCYKNQVAGERESLSLDHIEIINAPVQACMESIAKSYQDSVEAVSGEKGKSPPESYMNSLKVLCGEIAKFNEDRFIAIDCELKAIESEVQRLDEAIKEKYSEHPIDFNNFNVAYKAFVSNCQPISDENRLKNQSIFNIEECRKNYMVSNQQRVNQTEEQKERAKEIEDSIAADIQKSMENQ